LPLGFFVLLGEERPQPFTFSLVALLQRGAGFLVIAFGVIIIGGLGSMLGTFIGGIVLGLTQTLSGHFLGAAWQMLFVYLIVFVVLAVRPQGIFGR